MIPVTTGILIVLLKFPRGICSTVYLLMNGVVKKISLRYLIHREHGVPQLTSTNQQKELYQEEVQRELHRPIHTAASEISQQNCRDTAGDAVNHH